MFNLLQNAIAQTLRDRFKELRRPKKLRPLKSDLTPESVYSEDSVSFKCHNNALKAEYRKLNPNYSVVNNLMSMSFAMRWEDLHTNCYDIKPFLRISDQVWV